MSDVGYVYLLINHSMPGLVKIGRTARPVAERIDELSAATAVPTPFELVYDILVDNCAATEAELHRHFALRGYRVSANRGFFQAPIREVLDIMLRLPQASESGASANAPRPLQPATAAGVVLHDPLFWSAAALCVRDGEIAIHSIQREFWIDFSRAMRLFDELIWVGVAEPGDAMTCRARIDSDGLARLRSDGSRHAAG